MKKATIYFLLGPSGSGKTTTTNYFLEKYPETYSVLVSDTTRKIREIEKNGHDYYFKSIEEFENTKHINRLLINDNINWAYGVSYDEIDRINNSEKTFIYPVIDPHMATEIEDYIKNNKLEINCKYIYVDVSKEKRRTLLKNRGETDEAIERRLEKDPQIINGKMKVYENTFKKPDLFINDMYQSINKIKEWENSQKNVYMISGQAGAGKDLMAEIINDLLEKDSQQLSFIRPIKEWLYNNLSEIVKDFKNELSLFDKFEYLKNNQKRYKLYLENDKDKILNETENDLRNILQKSGTDVLKPIFGDNFLVKLVSYQIEKKTNTDSNINLDFVNNVNLTKLKDKIISELLENLYNDNNDNNKIILKDIENDKIIGSIRTKELYLNLINNLKDFLLNNNKTKTTNNIIISDFRFPIEYSDLIIDFHNKININTINLVINKNLSRSNTGHISEMALNDFSFDIVIENKNLEKIKKMSNKYNNDKNINNKNNLIYSIYSGIENLTKEINNKLKINNPNTQEIIEEKTINILKDFNINIDKNELNDLVKKKIIENLYKKDLNMS